MEYTVIGGTSREIDDELNRLAPDGWSPVTMTGAGGSYVVILERPDEQDDSVQQWEDQTLGVFGLTVEWIDGVDQHQRSKPKVFDALRQAGDDGWELISTTEEGGWYRYTFMRPKE